MNTKLPPKKSLLSKIRDYFLNTSPPTTSSSQSLTEEVNTVLYKMAIIGLFDTIITLAESGKVTANSIKSAAEGHNNVRNMSTSLVRVYLNGILNAAAIAEEAIQRLETPHPRTPEEEAEKGNKKKTPPQQNLSSPTEGEPTPEEVEKGAGGEEEGVETNETKPLTPEDDEEQAFSADGNVVDDKNNAEFLAILHQFNLDPNKKGSA
jgi:hypothetical protein